MNWLKHLKLTLILALLATMAACLRPRSSTPVLPTSGADALPEAPLQAATVYPTAPIVPTIPDPVRIIDFSVTPLNDQEIGVNVCTSGRGGVGLTIRVSYNTSNLGDDSGTWQVIKELGVPCFTPTDRPVWNITDLKPGVYLLRVEVKTPEDPNWLNPVTATIAVDVKSGKG